MSPFSHYLAILISNFVSFYWFTYVAIQDFRDAQDATNFSAAKWVLNYAIQSIPLFAVAWILIYTILMMVFGLAAALWNGVSTVWGWIF